MARSLSIDPDALEASLAEIFGEVDSKSEDALNGAVKHGAKVSAKEWRSGAPVNRGKYKKSIRTKVTTSDGEPDAVVYSTEPGLPHLLEKGHAKIGGGRTRAVEHVAPAADAGFDAAMDELGIELGKAGL